MGHFFLWLHNRNDNHILHNRCIPPAQIHDMGNSHRRTTKNRKMEKTITKVIIVCDYCQKEIVNKVNYVCSVCDKRVCSNCLAVGGIFSKHYYNTHPDVCDQCYQRQEVQQVINNYAKKYAKMERKEATELSKLQMNKHPEAQKQREKL